MAGCSSHYNNTNNKSEKDLSEGAVLILNQSVRDLPVCVCVGRDNGEQSQQFAIKVWTAYTESLRHRAGRQWYSMRDSSTASPGTLHLLLGQGTGETELHGEISLTNQHLSREI